MASSWLSVTTDWLVDAAAAHSSVSTSTVPTQNASPKAAVATHAPTAPPITGKTRRQRLLHCRQKTITAFVACLPALQGVVEELTSTSQATRQLKELRKQQKEVVEKAKSEETDNSSEQEQLQRLQMQQDELWRQIVVENTTRMMASSYTYTLLLLSLTVQLHWISGNREALLQEGQQTESSSSTELAQSMLMQSHQYLVESGIPLLVKTIRRSVEATMLGNHSNSTSADWTKPTQFMSIQDVERLLYQQIPHALKYGSSASSSITSLGRNWVRFVLPDEECFDPIWDVCSSPVWEDAQEEILEKLWYGVLRDHDTDGWKHMFESSMENEMHQPPQKPVAKIVAQFKKSSNLVFAELANDDDATPRASNSNTLLVSLQKLPTVLELGEVSFQRHNETLSTTCSTPNSFIQKTCHSMPTIKGTSSVVDDRARKKAMKKSKFPSSFSKQVDLQKVNRLVLTQWIEQKVTTILGFDDEIVSSTAINLFLPAEGEDPPDPKRAQLDLAGFLGENESAAFAKELWKLMVEAQESRSGIPKTLLEQKKKELADKAGKQQQNNSAPAGAPRPMQDYVKDAKERARMAKVLHAGPPGQDSQNNNAGNRNGGGGGRWQDRPPAGPIPVPMSPTQDKERNENNNRSKDEDRKMPPQLDQFGRVIPQHASRNNSGPPQGERGRPPYPPPPRNDRRSWSREHDGGRGRGPMDDRRRPPDHGYRGGG
ncbi:MAG: hypothetical protein SGARI_000321, partial [Bacillariaceae sp.]